MNDTDVETGRVSLHAEYNDAVLHAPPARVSAGAHVSSLDEYKKMYDLSLSDPSKFWGDVARSSVSWFRDFTQV
jgi:acetyl-CoA synthetase